MPSFYPRTLPRQMPLTPPDYLPSYTANGCGGMQVTQGPYSALPGMSVPHEKARYEYAEHYGQSSAFPAAGPMMFHQPPAYNGGAPSGIAHQQQMYGAVAAPLPPIRAQDPSAADMAGLQQRRQQEQSSRSEKQPKEEKAVGGVAAHLDYEMDQMSDFVSEMAQGIVQPCSPVPPAFRKWVSQILSSTRLPSSTILLGLYYLSTRMSMLSAGGQYKASSGQVYRMLTIALVLGSKFLDDNTFQNRSWSEVSGIAVTELNTLEVEWLVAINWNLHVDPSEQQGVMAWRSHWDDWKEKAAARASKASKLAPLDTGVQRQRSQPKSFSPAPPYPSHYNKSNVPNSGLERQTYQAPTQYDQWLYPQSTTERSPSSAPETGPNTPEYYGLPGTWSFNPAPPPYSMRSVPAGVHPAHAGSQPPSYHHTPYAQQYAPSVWNGHGIGCHCMYCARPHESYFMGSNFGAQTVAG